MYPTLALASALHGFVTLSTVLAVTFLVGMALSTQDIVLAKRRFFHAAAVDAALYQMTIAFFSWLTQQGNKPDLQVVEFSALTNTDVVLADSPCRLFALFLHKATATASYFKATDHATTCSTDGTQDVSLRMAQIDTRTAYFWPKGKSFAAGITCQANTTGTGSTGSAANGADGVALIGKP